jgi:plastocyanin
MAFLIIAATAVACGDDDDGGGSSEPVTSATITMRDNSFSPNNITVPAGQPVTFTLENRGAGVHNMQVEGPDGNYGSADDIKSTPETINAGQSGRLVATFAAAGTVDFRCEFHPDDMKGKITVR